ncbi:MULTISPECIES: c-type cytochrome [Mesorhizobium]|uniref:Cytochrome C556 n=1 Tax=Mesorhizobium denitrificans TaxID=2294114 RepID=A0A371XHS2_9HYPH|nr:MULTISPECIES: cytochrome c [Mesorhizobium]RFC68785.1 cytochrome C556 [Mesorhizobium denitrificans]
MRKLLLALSAIALTAGAVHADPKDDREALMKERGKIVGGLVKMVKGETPFDAAATLAALQTLDANAEKGLNVDALWPAGSNTDETSPKIWEDNAAFKAEAAKFKTVADAAVASPPADLAALQATVGTIGKECSACHEVYRIKK